MDRRLCRRPALRPHPGTRRLRARERHPVGHRRAPAQPRRGHRRDHRVLRPGGRVRRAGRRGPDRPRRPGGGRDRQRHPDRRARAVARGERPSRRRRADPSRDRRPCVVDPRPDGGARPDRRRGGPPARVGRLTHRSVGRGNEIPVVGLLGRRRDAQRPRLGQERRPQARPGGGRAGLRRATPLHDRRLPRRRSVPHDARDQGVHHPGRHPGRHRRPADGGGRAAARRALGRLARARDLYRRRCRDALGARDPRLDRDRERQPDGGAGPLADRRRAACRCGAQPAPDRHAHHRAARAG